MTKSQLAWPQAKLKKIVRWTRSHFLLERQVNDHMSQLNWHEEHVRPCKEKGSSSGKSLHT